MTTPLFDAARSQADGLPYGDVLTPGGWCPIGDLVPGEPVFGVNADGVLIETVITGHCARHYDGEMIHARARGLKLTCTPGHRVAKLGGIKRQPNFSSPLFSPVAFRDLPGQAVILRRATWDGKPLEAFTLGEWPSRPRRLAQPRSLAGRSFAGLLGWYLSEGHTSDRDKSFSITQMKPASRARLREFLERECGFSVTWSDKDARIVAAEWWAYLRQFGKSRQKFVPRWVKAGTAEDLRAIFTSLMDGDGHWENQPRSGTYFTISRRLADDVAEIAVKLGYLVCMSTTERPDRDGLRYNIHVKRTVSGGTELLTGHHVYNLGTRTKRASDIQAHPHRGIVHRLAIKDAQAFVVRQDWSVWVSAA